MRPPRREGLSRIPVRRLGLLGAAAFVVFMIALFPARLAWQWEGRRLPSLRLTAIDGTLWNGTATGVVLAGVPLGTASLSWRPLALFLGEWRHRVRLELPVGEAAGKVGWTLTGAKVASDFALRTSLSQVLRYLPGAPSALPAGVEGDVVLGIEDLVVRDGVVQRLEGSLRLANVTVAGNSVGALVAELHDRDGGVVADFRSAGDSSPGIEGTAFWHPAGDYRLQLAVAEPDRLGGELGALVTGFAAQENGAWRVDWQGRF